MSEKRDMQALRKSKLIFFLHMFEAHLNQRADMLVCNIINRKLSLSPDPHEVKLPESAKAM
jgi:hypothetical protein